MAEVIEEVVDEGTGAVSPEVHVDLNDPLLTGIMADEQADKHNITTTYDGVIGGVDDMVTQQQQAIDDSTQAEIDAQNKYTEDTVNIIEGHKEEARDDYDDETRGAYVDWKQATDPFGVNAEKMAANGLSGSGYSESSKVRMFQAYQSRKALAYKAFTKAITEYNNQITMARSQNSVTIAQIASDAIKEKARIALEGFYYKNDLIIDKSKQIMETNRYYDGLWMDTYDSLWNREKDERDFLQRQAEERQAQANWQAEFDREGEQNTQKQSNWQAEFDALYGDKDEEEEEVIIDKDDDEGNDAPVEIPPINSTVTPPTIPASTPIPTPPPLSSGNPSIDRMMGVAAAGGDDLKFPNYPMLPNGRPAHLTVEEVGVHNIHSVDDSNIKKELGDISAEDLSKLVERGAIKEVLYKDKDGKIGLKFEIANRLSIILWKNRRK